jgi:hypothetical protein
VESILLALGARATLGVLWNGPELDRLLDAGHASLSAAVKRRLERWGWLVRVEVSFSRYGERGRIDLAAWHPLTRALVVIEVKTDLVDAQALLGGLDVKARLARHAVEPFGWEVSAVVPAIVFAEDRTVRNRLARVEGLFDRYDFRGRAATAWLRRPAAAPRGLLWFTATHGYVVSRSDAPRVRLRRADHAASSPHRPRPG